MVIGVGLDVVGLERVARWLSEGNGERIVRRLLTDGERRIWDGLAASRQVEFLAGRFAAKEAVAKAFGCGIGGVMGFRDIEVVPDERGKPVCRLSAEAWQRLGLKERGHAIHVSVTHDRTIAAAMAVVERIAKERA